MLYENTNNNNYIKRGKGRPTKKREVINSKVYESRYYWNRKCCNRTR